MTLSKFDHEFQIRHGYPVDQDYLEFYLLQDQRLLSKYLSEIREYVKLLESRQH
jgi:hypothetical protein